ncbi:unnamed protein product [Pieris brassicae]|uniref:Secreted protein n=1 Tax=Pieris brassicae TaxID=7116 RepID=A0A9P0X3C3_PIEBR|nr:unnamed protein product [Pieris brassicae]
MLQAGGMAISGSLPFILLLFAAQQISQLCGFITRPLNKPVDLGLPTRLQQLRIQSNERNDVGFESSRYNGRDQWDMLRRDNGGACSPSDARPPSSSQDIEIPL